MWEVAKIFLSACLFLRSVRSWFIGQIVLGRMRSIAFATAPRRKVWHIGLIFVALSLLPCAGLALCQNRCFGAGRSCGARKPQMSLVVDPTEHILPDHTLQGKVADKCARGACLLRGFGAGCEALACCWRAASPDEPVRCLCTYADGGAREPETNLCYNFSVSAPPPAKPRRDSRWRGNVGHACRQRRHPSGLQPRQPSGPAPGEVSSLSFNLVRGRGNVCGDCCYF